MDRGCWGATVHGVTKSQTQLSDQAQHACTHTHAHNVTIPTPLGQCAFVPQGWGVVTRRTW